MVPAPLRRGDLRLSNQIVGCCTTWVLIKMEELLGALEGEIFAGLQGLVVKHFSLYPLGVGCLCLVQYEAGNRC